MSLPGCPKGDCLSARHAGALVSRARPGRRFGRAFAAALIAAAATCIQAGPREDFFKAIELDRVQMLKPVLAAGFDPNTTDERGNTGLMIALREGCFEVAEVLLSQPQVRIDQANASGETPVMMAALRGQAVWVARLLDRGAAVNREGWTPLHYAASGPEPKVIGLLLERGARIDALSANGTTPLMMAAGYGVQDGAEVLLRRGADTGLRNARGLSAADFARRAGRDALAARLETPVR